MKITLRALFCSAALVLCFTAQARAENIRVALEKSFKNVGSVPISESVIGVGIGDNMKYTINGTAFAVSPVGGEYYTSNMVYDSFDEAHASMADYTGHSCITALTDNGWTVYIRTDETPLQLNKIHTGSFCVGFAENGVYKFIVDGSSPARVNTPSGTIGLGSKRYRDDIELYRQGNAITAVNVIDDEKYLYGVINSEMPASWSAEAQKAQAVAARTYMKRNLKKHEYADVCDGTHCQDYNGTEKETEAGIAAVDATKGLCIYYDNTLIDAVYFSSDGGALLNSADVWGGDTPYLKAKADIYEKEYREWTREYTYNELTNICSANGYGIGNVVSVNAEYDANGAVLKLTFLGSQGSKTITGNDIRTAFSPGNEGSLPSRNFVLTGGAQTTVTGAPIYVVGTDGGVHSAGDKIIAGNSEGKTGAIGSSFYARGAGGSVRKDAPVTVTTGKAGIVTLDGKGFGHGTGMSQYGAKSMAESGFTFKDILKFYYTGVEIK